MRVSISQEPRPISDKVFMASNVFTLKSRKVAGRLVSLIGPTLFDAWYLLEFDPDVVAICERPRMDIAIVRSKKSRGLDFWFARQNGSQCGVVVQGGSRGDKHIPMEVLQDSVAASGISCEIWRECDLLRRRLFLRNLKQMLPYLCQEGAIDFELVDTIERIVREGGSNGTSLSELFKAQAQRSRTQVAASLFAGYSMGRVIADLEHAALSANETRWTAP